MIRFATGLILAFTTVAVVFESSAQASILLEPGLAYHSGSYDDGASSHGKMTGVGLNVRGAFAFPVVFVGLDMSYMFGTQTPDSGSSNDLTAVALGPVVGVSLPLLPLRFWATYYLLDYATAKVSTPVSGDFVQKGSAFKIGAGYTFLPMLSVNLEYAMHTYTSYTFGSVSADETPNVKNNEFILSVSIPLDL